MRPPPGDAASPRRQQEAYSGSVHRWLPKRRGMAAGAIAAALLLALALLRRDSGPTWVASAVPTQVNVTAGSKHSALSSSSSAEAAAAAAAAGNARSTVDRREALQQSAGEDGTASGSSVQPHTSAKDAGNGGRGSSSSGSSHTRSSKASKAAGKAAGSASAAAAGVQSPAASAQPVQQSGNPSEAGNPAADAVDDAAEDAPDGDNRGAGAGDGAASRAAGAAADAHQAANQASEADGGASDGSASDDAPQQEDSEDSVKLQTNSTSAAADPSIQQGSKLEASDPTAASDGGQSAESAEPAEQSAGAGAQSAPAPQRARKAPRQKPKQPAKRQDAAVAKAAPQARQSKGKGKGKGQGKRPRPAHDSFGPIQAELLAAVEAAVNPDGAVMLAVTNKEGALFQLPQLLSSMRLVPQADISRHLVVVTYSAPAQAACLRQHPLCVLDDFGTGGLGGDDGGGIDAFAAWGSRRFKGITWRKIQLVQDILLQGYAVLSVDLDIVLFKDPLDGAFNPLMNRELDGWVAVDNGKMLNCGFYFLRPTEPTDEFMKEWLGRFKHDAADDIWEQAEFNQILKGAHATMPQLKWDKLDEEWFVDLCFYLDARAVLPDQRRFGELFAATSDKLGNWDKMFGFHAACCKGGGPALPECKRSTATALMMWQIHAQPSEWL